MVISSADGRNYIEIHALKIRRCKLLEFLRAKAWACIGDVLANIIDQHPFWNQKTPAPRRMQWIHTLQNPRLQGI